MATALDVKPVTPLIGAEISGVDLSKPLSDNELGAVKQALRDHLVIFFRDQDMTPDQQKDFGRQFGDLHLHPARDRKGQKVLGSMATSGIPTSPATPNRRWAAFCA
jgi:taurine dioxygenase